MKAIQDLPKIDAHIHFNADRKQLFNVGGKYNFRFLTINTKVPEFPSVLDQREIAIKHRQHSEGQLQFITTVDSRNIFDEGWTQKAVSKIQSDLDKGAKGVKFWKNIGMSVQCPKGSFLMPDAPELESLFKFLEDEGIPVLGHQGEPKNCWLPVEQMTVKSDREYFAAHPQYHMYQKTDYPDYWDHIHARDRVLERHPRLRFVGAHLASLEWNLDEVAKRLRRFPNLAVDLAERISHLEYQARDDYQKVIDFFETYQDRIIYGTDIIDDPQTSAEEIEKELIKRWTRHWKFFSTDDELTSDQVHGTFQGLNLPDSILEKIYYKNAERWYLGKF